MTCNFSKKYVRHYIWYFKIVCILMKLDLWGSKMNLKWITIIKVEEYLYTGLKFNFSRFLLWLVMFNEKHVGHYIWYFKIVCIFLKFELWGSRMTLKWITIIHVKKKSMSALHCYKISSIGPYMILARFLPANQSHSCILLTCLS